MAVLTSDNCNHRAQIHSGHVLLNTSSIPEQQRK